jgi:predicted  nucleic acid-binding Zn-ribbon protein
MDSTQAYSSVDSAEGMAELPQAERSQAYAALETAENNIDSLQAERAQLLDEVTSIKTQLYEAKSTAAKTGEYSDTDWFRDANHALKKRQQRIQVISLEMGKLKRRAKHLESIRFERIFIDEARKQLNPVQLRCLMDTALSRFNEEMQNLDME